MLQVIFFFLKARKKEKKIKKKRKPELRQGELPVTAVFFIPFFFSSTSLLRVLVKYELFPRLCPSLSERLLISEMYFTRLMDEAINFFFDPAFLVWNKLAAIFLLACLCICFVSSSLKVNLDGCNGIYTYRKCHLKQTFYQASLNLQSAPFNLENYA